MLHGAWPKDAGCSEPATSACEMHLSDLLPACRALLLSWRGQLVERAGLYASRVIPEILGLCGATRTGKLRPGVNVEAGPLLKPKPRDGKDLTITLCSSADWRAADSRPYLHTSRLRPSLPGPPGGPYMLAVVS